MARNADDQAVRAPVRNRALMLAALAVFGVGVAVGALGVITVIAWIESGVGPRW
jgi:hypothetical protein